MTDSTSPVALLGRAVSPSRPSPPRWSRSSVIAPAARLAPTRASARTVGASAARIAVAAGGRAVDLVKEVAQASAEHGVGIAIIPAAVAPMRHAACSVSTAPAAAAVVGGESPPRGVERNKRSRRLPLPPGTPVPGLLAAGRGAETTRPSGEAAAANGAPRRTRRRR